MKKIFTFILLLGLFVSPVAFAQTEEESEAPRPEFLREFRARQLENRERVQEIIAGTRSIANSKLARHQVRTGIIKKFQGALDRMVRGSEKLSERVTNFKEKGVEVGDAEALIISAQESIALAQDKVEEMIAFAEANQDDEDERVRNRRELRKMFDEAKDHLIDAREALGEAIADLREGIVAYRGNDDESSDDSTDEDEEESADEESEDEEETDEEDDTEDESEEETDDTEEEA